MFLIGEIKLWFIFMIDRLKCSLVNKRWISSKEYDSIVNDYEIRRGN